MRSYLSKHVPKAPTPEEEMRALRRRAWLEDGVISIPVGEILDGWERQILTNIANRVYGRRKT